MSRVMWLQLWRTLRAIRESNEQSLCRKTGVEKKQWTSLFSFEFRGFATIGSDKPEKITKG